MSSTESSGQFVTPVPEPQPAESLNSGRYQSGFYHSLSKEERASIESGEIEEPRSRNTRSGSANKSTRILWRRPATRIALRPSAPKPLQKEPMQSGRAPERLFSRLASYTTGTCWRNISLQQGSWEMPQFFRALLQTFLTKEAYVTPTLSAASLDSFLFAINYAAVVVKDDSGSTSIERRAIESQKANVMRMINNGGTLTMRAQLPVWAVRSPIQQTAASVYASGGLVGPTGNTDSLRASAAVVAEFATSRSIRSIGTVADLLGELLLAARLGYAISEKELLTATGDKGFGYIQIAVGLLQNNKISLSALYTHPFEERYRRFSPKLTLNLAAVR